MRAPKLTGSFIAVLAFAVMACAAKTVPPPEMPDASPSVDSVSPAPAADTASPASTADTVSPPAASGTTAASAPAGGMEAPATITSRPGRSAGNDSGTHPPVKGIYQPLGRGMTLFRLSRTYNVPVATLMEANGIEDPTSIPAGTRIFIPGATERIPVEPFHPPSTALFSWPIRGTITAPFGRTRTRTHHSGIDIDGRTGDPIHAAADGRVVRAGRAANYGLLVVLAHDGGYTTWYGHASRLLVRKGDEVGRGQVIALVGQTGNARGSHLHFEVRRSNRPMNPLAFLEPGRGVVRAGAR